MSMQSQFKSKILLETIEPLPVIKDEPEDVETYMDDIFDSLHEDEEISTDIKDEIDIAYHIIPEDLIKEEPIPNNLLESEHFESVETQIFDPTENTPFIKTKFENLVDTEGNSHGNLRVEETQVASKHVLSFSAIAAFFKEDMGQLQRGEHSYESGNVKKMLLVPDGSPAILTGEVAASMKNKTYKVEIFIDCDDGIVEAHCACPRGQAVCHHMAALCLHAHHKARVRVKKKPTESKDIKKMKDLYKTKRDGYMAVGRQATSNEVVEFRNALGHANPVGFTWYLMSEPSAKANIIPDIQRVLEEYANTTDKDEYLKRACEVSDKIILEVELLTKGQSQNENRLIARKYRLTSSKFGSVLAACKRSKFPRSLFISLVEGYDLRDIQAIQWSRENEQAAITSFEEKTGLQVKPAGFCLEKCGFLGASPDGYIGVSCLIEVKCPFKLRKEDNLKNALKDKNYVVYFDGDNLVINERHVYIDQIQGALHITQRDMCYLVVWIPKDVLIVRIARDDNWENNLNILKAFYLQKFVPFILS